MRGETSCIRSTLARVANCCLVSKEKVPPELVSRSRNGRSQMASINSRQAKTSWVGTALSYLREGARICKNATKSVHVASCSVTSAPPWAVHVEFIPWGNRETWPCIYHSAPDPAQATNNNDSILSRSIVAPADPPKFTSSRDVRGSASKSICGLKTSIPPNGKIDWWPLNVVFSVC